MSPKRARGGRTVGFGLQCELKRSREKKVRTHVAEHKLHTSGGGPITMMIMMMTHMRAMDCVNTRRRRRESHESNVGLMSVEMGRKRFSTYVYIHDDNANICHSRAGEVHPCELNVAVRIPHVEQPFVTQA